MSTPSDELVRRDLQVLWHPCSQMKDYESFAPLHVTGASGSRIRLADGREVIDAISSWWCKSLGHGHPRLTAALIDQAKRFEHVILANTTHEPVVRLCERLCDVANGHASIQYPKSEIRNHFTKVFLADNGSTAVEIAMKMALQSHAQSGRAGRTRFAHFENGYHGETIATLSVGDCGLYGNPFRPLMFPSVRLTGLPYRIGPDDSRWFDASAEWPVIERQLDAVADELAAIVYEPVLQAAGGLLLYSPDLLPRLRAWADAHDVYLIADEIASGMGRCGEYLASHLSPLPPLPPGESRVRESSHELDEGKQFSDERPLTPALSRGERGSIPLTPALSRGERGAIPLTPALSRRERGSIPLPDFALLSNGLTGGYLPLSAVLTTERVYQSFYADYVDMKAFLHSNTYTGNALAVAVANAALDVYRDEGVLNVVKGHGPLLRAALKEVASSRPYLKNVRGVGMMAAVDIRRRDGSPIDAKRRTGFAVYREAVQRGALLRNLGDTMYLFPPLNIASADVGELGRILSESLDAVLQ